MAEPNADALRAARKAVDQRIVEVNMDQVRYLQRFLGQEERERLDIHLESLEDLQRRIQAAELDGGAMLTPSLTAGSCAEPELTMIRRQLNDEESITRWSQLQSDILFNAFTCDVTRSGVMQYSFSGGHHEGLLGFSDSWHDAVAHVSVTHDSVNVGPESMSTRAAFGRFSRFWAGNVAYLVRRLAETAEGDGSMLDNTLLYWGVESGTNHSHTPSDMQYLLIGGRNMGFQLGQYLQLPAPELANKLHTAVLQGFGYDAVGFGLEDNCGALSGIVG